jgi:dGTPase
VGQRFLVRTQPSLEAQVCNLADEIAYNAHDIDDGVRSGLITMAQLEAVPFFECYRQAALAEYPHLGRAAQGRRLLYESIRRMLSAQVHDVIAVTGAALAQYAPCSADQARVMPPLVQFGETTQRGAADLKRFLMKGLYRHPQVMQTTGLARQVVVELFAAYLQRPQEMQPALAEPAPKARHALVRAVADYIAGMTDRMATREHERLTGQRLLT